MRNAVFLLINGINQHIVKISEIFTENVMGMKRILVVLVDFLKISIQAGIGCLWRGQRFGCRICSQTVQNLKDFFCLAVSMDRFKIILRIQVSFFVKVIAAVRIIDLCQLPVPDVFS